LVHPSQNGTAIIAAHARNGNRTGMIYHADFLAKHGYGVLLFDLRGHGESQGKCGSTAGRSSGYFGCAGLPAEPAGREANRIGALGLSRAARSSCMLPQ